MLSMNIIVVIVVGVLILIPPLIVFLFYRNYDRLVSYIPTYCTSVGILATFWILYRALGHDIDNIDLNGADSIQNLIKELSNKFLSSLVGIGGSIFWSILIRFDEGKKEAQLNANSPWRKKNPQEILWEISEQQLRMIAVNEEAITTSVKNSEKIIETVNRIRVEISRSMSVETENIIRSQNELRAEVSGFRNAIEHSISGLMTDYEVLIKQLVENLSNQTITTFSQSIENISLSLRELTAQLLDSHRQSLDTGFEGIIGRFGNLNDSLAVLTTKIVDQTESIRESSANSNEAIQTQFSTTTERMIGVNQGIAENFNNVLLEIRDRIAGMGEEIQASFQGILDRNAESVDNAFEKLVAGQVRSSSLLDVTTDKFAAAVSEYQSTQMVNEGVLLSMANQNILLGEIQRIGEFHLNNWKLQLAEMQRLIENIDDIATAIDQLQHLNDTLSRFHAKTS